MRSEHFLTLVRVFVQSARLVLPTPMMMIITQQVYYLTPVRIQGSVVIGDDFILSLVSCLVEFEIERGVIRGERRESFFSLI